MKKVLIGVILGLFLIGIASIVSAEEHIREYRQWREKVSKNVQLNMRCLEVKKDISKLADDIKNKYGNSSDNLKFISNYIEWLHVAFSVLKRDSGAKGLSGTKMSDIPCASASSDEPTRWLVGELLKAMEPLDELAYIADKDPYETKKISSAKLDNVRFLHIVIKNLQNGGDLRKAIQEVDAFEGKFEKSSK